MKRILAISAAVPAALLLIVLTVAFVPDDALRGLLSRSLESQGYTLRAARIGKALPLGVSVAKLEIGTEQGAIIKADEAKVRLRLLPLLLGRVQIAATARIGNGSVNGVYTVTGGGSASLDVSNVRLEDIPFFPTVTGGQAKGDLRGKAVIKGLGRNPAGDMQLEVRGAELAGLKMGGMPLPDATYSSIQGKLVIRGAKATLESLTLQGDGLYARLKGDMPLSSPLSAAPLNVTLELMPKPEFLEKQKFVFLLLTKYLDTPGHYLIPVRGTLGRPAAF